MRSNLFWLSDPQWDAPICRLTCGVMIVWMIGGILDVLKSGCRWCDCPPEYAPATTTYDRFVRWAERGVWEHLFRELAGRGRSSETQMIDSTHIKAHRSASSGKGGSRNRRLAAHAAGAIRRSTQSQMLKAAFFPSC